MVMKVETFETSDGLLFKDQKKAVIHESVTALLKRFPELKSSKDFLERNIFDLCDLMEDAASYHAKNHPEAEPQDHPDVVLDGFGDPAVDTPKKTGPYIPDPTTREEEEPICECGALLAGNTGALHTLLCALHPDNLRARYIMSPIEHRLKSKLED